MTRRSSCHLLDMLAEVPDPRKKKGQRHQGHSIVPIHFISVDIFHL